MACNAVDTVHVLQQTSSINTARAERHALGACIAGTGGEYTLEIQYVRQCHNNTSLSEPSYHGQHTGEQAPYASWNGFAHEMRCFAVQLV